MSKALIPDAWKAWLRHNLDRGCDRDDLLERALSRGFSRAAIEAVLDAVEPASSSSNWLRWFDAPLTRPDHQPRAWRLNTPCSAWMNAMR